MRLLALLALLMVAIGSFGCGSKETGAPTISLFKFTGQDPANPRKLLFRITWADADGDMSGGKAQFFVDGNGMNLFPLGNVIPPGIVGSTLDNLHLELDGSQLLEGQEVKIGLQLVDAAGHRSNHPWIKFKVTF